jgi:hypothetical protein
MNVQIKDLFCKSEKGCEGVSVGVFLEGAEKREFEGNARVRNWKGGECGLEQWKLLDQ